MARRMRWSISHTAWRSTSDAHVPWSRCGSKAQGTTTLSCTPSTWRDSSSSSPSSWLPPESTLQHTVQHHGTHCDELLSALYTLSRGSASRICTCWQKFWTLRCVYGGIKERGLSISAKRKSLLSWVFFFFFFFTSFFFFIFDSFLLDEEKLSAPHTLHILCLSNWYFVCKYPTGVK